MDPHQIGSYCGQILIFPQQRKVCCNLEIQLVMKEVMVFFFCLQSYCCYTINYLESASSKNVLFGMAESSTVNSLIFPIT